MARSAPIISEIQLDTGAPLRLIASQIRQERTGVHACVRIALGDVDLEWDTFNVGRAGDRGKLANAAHAKCPLAVKTACPKDNLHHALDNFCAVLWTRFLEETGEHMVTVGTNPRRPEKPWRLKPIIPLGNTAVMFAPGGSGKSTLAAYFAVAVNGGMADNTISAKQGRVAYLDWESDSDDFNDIVSGLTAGLPAGIRSGIIYRRMSRPLEHELAALEPEIEKYGIDTLIVDSAAPASGGTKEAREDAGPVMETLRYLATSNLVIAHSPKPQFGIGTSVYGDVFWVNRARHVLELRTARSLQGHGLKLALLNRKTNMGPEQPPLAYSVDWHADGSITCTPEDISKITELRSEQPLYLQARAVLAEANGPMTIAEIALALADWDESKAKVSVSSVKAQLNKHKEVFYSSGGGGKGKVAQWSVHASCL